MDFESAKQRSLDEAILFLGYIRGKGKQGRPQLLRASRAGGVYSFSWRIDGVQVAVEMDPETGEMITIERLDIRVNEPNEERRQGLVKGAWFGSLVSVIAIAFLVYDLSLTSLANPQHYLMTTLKVIALCLFYLLGLYWSLRLSRTTRKMSVLYSIWFLGALFVAVEFKTSVHFVRIPALVAALVYLLLAFAAGVANRRHTRQFR
ncbi:MAG: hypothetical protein OWT28_00345 [Firmicutes bacterium]|nr:hypothetical protein [Bacillota bacterium]